MRVLILGGTLDARELAGLLANRPDLDVRLSLAGRTASPVEQGVPVVSGGFGGIEGLAGFLREERIDVLIDATHPFAANISFNAAKAAPQAKTKLLALRRAPWTKVDGDRWFNVADIPAAVEVLGDAPLRVFLALGRNELASFVRAPQHHYLIRSVDPVDPPLDVPSADYIVARGPFTAEDDRALFDANRIDIVVAKNSGGPATYSKIEAARLRRMPVVMLQRPKLPDVLRVASVGEVVTWLDHAVTASKERGV